MTTPLKPTFAKNRLAATITSVMLGVSFTAAAADETKTPEDDAFETIVVTGTVGGRTQIESAVAVTSIDDEVIQNFKPNSEVELFRLIPGIQANGGNGPGGRVLPHRQPLPGRPLLIPSRGLGEAASETGQSRKAEGKT